MKRVEFMCDGCDASVFMPLNFAREADFSVEGWVTHRIVAFENGAQAYELAPDLCPKCSENLRLAINPTNWPRMRSVAQALRSEPVEVGAGGARIRRFAP